MVAGGIGHCSALAARRSDLATCGRLDPGVPHLDGHVRVDCIEHLPNGGIEFYLPHHVTASL